MKLEHLLRGTEIPYPAGIGDVEVTGLTYNSKLVKRGYLFVCIKGFHTDGHIYAMDAAFHGASVIVCEEDIPIKAVPVLRVDNGRRALSKLSANFYRNDGVPFHIYGITGTNGKTTIAYMLKSILEAAGSQCGMIGTIGHQVGSKEYEARNTTPESCDLHAMFAEMKEEGVLNCVMEVSSHALALSKVDDVEFEGAVFTNLTSDHMDFHKDTEDYFAAKKKLFTLAKGPAAVNLDDEYGRRLYEELKRENRAAAGYSLKDRNADYYAEILEATEKGSLIRAVEKGPLILPAEKAEPAEAEVPTLENAGREERIRLNTPGVFTIYNGLAALACARSAGYSLQSIRRGLENLKGVPGRFEPVENSKGIVAIVDYAHTPDGLENVLKTAAGFTKGKLVCVFGCGGDRDRKKRPMMGMVAGKYSDFCIITSDNPRTEKQEDITAEIEAGIYETGCNYEVVENRYEAIKKAVSVWKKGDIIIIAGKGHETYQIIGTEKFHFDDREAVREIIENGG